MRNLYFKKTRKNVEAKSRARSRPQSLYLKVSNCYLRYPHCTVEPRFNEPLYNDVLGMTNDFLQPGQRYNKMYGTEPRFNEILFIERFSLDCRKTKTKVNTLANQRA